MGRKLRRSFFKILLGDSIDTLRLPPAFVKQMRRVVPGKYILKGPNGRSRLVKLKKDGEDFFFQDGWRGFVKDCSLEFGDFLIFSLHGNSKFSIKVYGKSGCEKEIASGHRNTYQPALCKKKGKEVKAVESSRTKLPDFQNKSCNENWEKKQVVSGKRRSGSYAKKINVIDIECEQVDQAGCSSKTEDLYVSSARIQDDLRVVPVTTARQLGCGPTYSKNCKKPNLDRGYEARVEEEMEEGSVEILDSFPECKDLATLRKETLDTPVAKRSSRTMVYIPKGQTPKQKDRVIRAARRLKPEQPLASVTLRKSYITNGFMYFPRNFVRTYLTRRFKNGLEKQSKNARLRLSDGRTWHVNLICVQSIAYLSAGWPAFVRENNLREGDTCFFELIKTKYIEFKVSTYRPRQRLLETGR